MARDTTDERCKTAARRPAVKLSHSKRKERARSARGAASRWLRQSDTPACFNDFVSATHGVGRAGGVAFDFGKITVITPSRKVTSARAVLISPGSAMSRSKRPNN